MAVLDESVLAEVIGSVETELLTLLDKNDYEKVDDYLETLIVKLHQSIPDRKRISYGITYVVKTLAKELYKFLDKENKPTFDIGLAIYKHMPTFRTITVGLGIISHVGVNDVEKVLPVFEHASSHEQWEVREFAHMYIRKITKKHPERIQAFLLELVVSDDENQRRYASEALRPVGENKWINDQPDFSLKVLRQLFLEEKEYPRTSVGNNLSDLSRKVPELIYDIIEELISYKNEHAYWIAHRASRNLIIKDKERVMDLLGVDTYKYKNKFYKR